MDFVSDMVKYADTKASCTESRGCSQESFAEKGLRIDEYVVRVIANLNRYTDQDISGIFLQAYVQQLESSRLKLVQLEQELERVRQQVRGR